MIAAGSVRLGTARFHFESQHVVRIDSRTWIGDATPPPVLGQGSAGNRRKAWLFLMRLIYSGRDFAWTTRGKIKSAFSTATSGVWDVRADARQAEEGWMPPIASRCCPRKEYARILGALLAEAKK